MVKITPSNVKKVLGGGANVIAALGTISGVVGNQVKQSSRITTSTTRTTFRCRTCARCPWQMPSRC